MGTRGQVAAFVVVGIRVTVGVLVAVGAFGDMRLRVWVKETRRTQLWLRLGVKAGDVFSYLPCKAPRSRCTQLERLKSVARNNGPWISKSIAFARIYAAIRLSAHTKRDLQ